MSGNDKNNKNDPTHSSDLLNIPGKKKTIAKLISDRTSTLEATNQQDTTMIPPPELRKTFKINPQSDILSRVQSFLPQLEAANQQLQTADPAKLDIENVEEDSEQYIEMNLGLGVYEAKNNGTDTSDMEDEDDDNSNSDNDIVIPNSTDTRRTKPNIEIIEK